ncbi:MAG TPA: hypothetical protein VGL62_01010 [Vicinamibacterales bacterium]|jgi:hypothetical protein
MLKRCVCVAVVGAAGLAIGCVGSNPNAGQDRESSRRTPFRLSLIGCVRPAARAQGYVLGDVDVPPPAEQPIGSESADPNAVDVAQGSWVRLTYPSGDLHQYLGQRVSVFGDIVESGRNTIGTNGSGAPPSAEDLHNKFARSSNDSSTNPDRAIPPTTVVPASADANGDAPLIAVERMKTVAGTCDGKQQ